MPSVLTLSGRLMGEAVVSSARHCPAKAVWITDPTHGFFDAGVSAARGGGTGQAGQDRQPGPAAASIKGIQTGHQWAAVAEEVASAGWRTVEQLVRFLTGVALSDELRGPIGSHMIIDRSNVGNGPGGPQVPGPPSAFLRAWHLSHGS